ncbi:MAG: DEAD/DEAH box helicase [Clostridia bacterium]|nr:DEAD/DEAH box helicase [Clostridia bacterium]
MPLYPLKKISALADGRQAYLRGVSGYNTGWVREYTSTPDAFYPELITATVQEPAATYRVEVGFGDVDEATHLECTCGQFRPGHGACKHIVAALVHKYYKDMLDGPPASTAPVTRAGGETDPAARQLIDQYLSREAARLTAAEEHEPPVSLQPMLTLAGGRASVAFTVGHERPYSIKNLLRFGEQMARGETAVYGKQLTLLHHRGRFAPESLPLLEFLLAELTERQGIPQAMLGNVGELRLSPAGFDRLFSLLLGSTVALCGEDGEHRITLAEGLPTLPLTIRKERDGVRIIGEPVQTVYGTSTLYLLHRGTLYRTGSEYTRRMTEWLRTVNRCPQGLFIATEQLPAFCSGVWTAIRPYIRPEGDMAALESSAPPPMRTEIRLDLPQPDTVTARVIFRYGGGLTAGYATAPQPWQDTLKELRVRLLLQRYFSADPDDPELLRMDGDEAALYGFITQGLPKLEQVAEVYPTAAMQQVSLATAPRFTVSIGLVDDLLNMQLELEHIDPAELAGILSGYRENRPYHRLQDGRFIALDSVELARLAELAEGLGLSPKDLKSGHLSLPKYRALYLERLLREHRGDVRRDRTFTSLLDRFSRAVNSRYELPASLQPVLRGYQRAGYRWLRTMEELGFGGILADDMGLGKTIQIIALLLAAKEAGNTVPSLVVCPTSVVLGWEREIARFTPALRVLCVIGDAAERRRRLDTVSSYDVIITSYDMLKRDVDAYTPLTFRYHVLDEAQYIKNSRTQNARAVKTIRAASRFALTGTPVENRLGELWSIMDFLMPGLLFSYPKFRSRLEQPILREQDDRALTRLRRMVSPFILRRLKSEVLAELPPKTERVLPATMDRPQRQVYLSAIAQLRQQITGMGHLTGKNRLTVLAMLTRLRQLCCDPRLCCEGYTGGSCKLDACIELLQEATAGGHKVLLFSQFTSMLAIIRKRLEQESISYYLLQGSTPKEERARLVEAFNTDETAVFLISLKAGGTGLNLTGADMVIHYDPWWNMSVQNQATDRAHRIGQKNPVQVIRLIARDTVEEKILQMQESKWQLAEQVVGGKTPSINDLTAEELLELLE